MKRLLRSGLLLLGLLGLPVSASAAGWHLPYRVDTGFKAWFHVYKVDPQAAAQPTAPWYLYYPYNGYFQTPAPVGGNYPHWQTQPNLVPSPAVMAPPGEAAGVGNAPGLPENLSPAVPPEGSTPPPGGIMTPGEPLSAAPARSIRQVAYPPPYSFHGAAYAPGVPYSQAPSYWYGR